MISKKIFNNEYAPGVATYGIDGKVGSPGENGNSIFYTSFDFYNNTAKNMELFLIKIRNRELPVHNSNVVLNRDYQVGDYFFDNNGNIYRLYNIEDIIHPSSSGNSNVWSNYLTLCGKMNSSTTNDYINKAINGRLNINNDYQGMDIIINNIGYNVDTTDYVLRIISDNPNSDNKIEFIKLSAINGYNISDQFNILYDTALNAYHIQTDGPLLIDSLVKVKESSDTALLDGYSPIVVNNTPITSFYNLCQSIQFQYYFDGEGDTGKIQKIGFTSDIIANDSNANILWHNIKDKITMKIVFNAVYEPLDADNYDEKPLDGNQTYTYMRHLKDEFGWNSENEFWIESINKLDKQANFVSKYINYDIQIISISLIYNIEVFTDFTNVNLAAINT